MVRAFRSKVFIAQTVSCPLWNLVQFRHIVSSCHYEWRSRFLRINSTKRDDQSSLRSPLSSSSLSVLGLRTHCLSLSLQLTNYLWVSISWYKRDSLYMAAANETETGGTGPGSSTDGIMARKTGQTKGHTFILPASAAWIHILPYYTVLHPICGMVCSRSLAAQTKPCVNDFFYGHTFTINIKCLFNVQVINVSENHNACSSLLSFLLMTLYSLFPDVNSWELQPIIRIF